MASSGNDAFSDVINLLAAPIASGIRAADQLRHGIDELIRAIENMNRTMDNLNQVADRVNALLADVEGPIRAIVPQVAHTVDTVDSVTRALDPGKVIEVVNAIGELPKRLAPLASLAENAGGLLGLAGGLRIPGLGAKPTTPIPPPQPRREPAPSSAKPAAKSSKKSSKKPSAAGPPHKKAAGAK